MPDTPGRHAIDQRLDILRYLFGASLDSEQDRRMELPYDPEVSRQIWDRLFFQNGLVPDGRPVKRIGLQFSASGLHKTWPEGHFSELGARLLASSEANVVCLVGGPADRKAARRLKEAISTKSGTEGRVLDLAGKIGLSRFPELIRGLDLLITNDTGPLHVAIAVGTPTISLFVPGEPGETGPVQDLAIHRVITREKPCSPCVDKYCKNPHCMGLIPVEEVYEEASRSLGQP